jgi:hypothetical protein
MSLHFVRSLLAVALFAACSSVAFAQQTVFLDFSGMEGSIVYTTAMKDDIETIMDGIYADFDFTFTQTAPMAGPFSTITFNSGGTGGLASKIDFRNLDKSDFAVVNVDGLGFSTTSDLVFASANIGAHELGHLQGLRHGDSFGPIGMGISSTVSTGSYGPSYPGPTLAHVDDHIMASPGSVGSALSDITTPNFFTERSYVKLEFNETGTTFAEAGGSKDTLATAQSVTFETLTALNTTKFVGHDAVDPDTRYAAFAVVDAEISAGSELDLYEFEITAEDVAGDSILNFEVLSTIIGGRYPFGSFDPTISILDSTGATGDFYYGESAFNDDELESLDSIMIDLLASEMGAGTFYIAVTPFSGAATGGYELFGYKTFAVPEPSSLAMIALFGGVLAVRRRRKDVR